jgi:hypothetical protein
MSHSNPVSASSSFWRESFVLTVQNFIYKHTTDSENVWGKKKNEKD